MGSRSCGPMTTLIFINLLVLVLGITVLAIGVVLNVDKKYTALNDLFHYDRVKDAESRNNQLINLNSVSIMLIIMGSVMTAISLIGILGTCCRSRFLMIFYCFVITILFLGMLSIAITVLIYKYAFQKDFSDEFKTYITTQIKNKYNGYSNQENPFTIAADIFMVSFECCGVYNYTDFNNAILWNKTLPDLSIAKSPVACCKFTPEQRNTAFMGEFPKLTDYTCASNPTSDNSNYLKGCFTEMNSYLSKIILVVLIISSIIGLLLLIATTHSCYLCCEFKRKRDTYDYRRGFRRYQQFQDY